ncbi:MAG: hypothetical protein QGF28_06325 [Candidatus Thalassarchaeaceae archaeon]|nr:hypothetical protein [Candidatus Thalassarchaeaceae archaeon]MDP7446794.1 hypothetical protein [Candidatus Thalassarchaeaceae archaeon]HJL54539.1 hypothetical protein [Candidatus Thalassarchaeaceae archaeon]HJM77724.1 hypothetical protein [Candidatus Thalassarchaeaceae archaeon]HJO84201.1 hypothetical protein [Candidatus Thalassarchaeaceae archaeon]
MVRPPKAERGMGMPDVDVLTQAAQSITQGDFMGAMTIFEGHIGASPDDPAGYHGWAEAALFEVQENGNMDEKGNDRINEGQIAAYFRKASGMEPGNADYLAAYANALIEFDRIPMAIRQFKKLKDLGDASDEVDVSFHLYEAARLLIDAIDLKTNFDRSEAFARQFLPVSVEFALLGLGFTSAEEALEYLQTE